MKYNWNIFFCPPHLATSWNCARVMLGPLNLFTISLILVGSEKSEEHLSGKKKERVLRGKITTSVLRVFCPWHITNEVKYGALFQERDGYNRK